MAYSNYIKLRILHHHLQGLKPYSIDKALETEGIQVSRFGVHKFIIMYIETGSIGQRPGSGHISEVTGRVKTLIKEQMQRDDETTAHQIHQMLLEHGINISFRTILRCRTLLGWTFHGSTYCQLIREAIKTKRLEWCDLDL